MLVFLICDLGSIPDDLDLNGPVAKHGMPGSLANLLRKAKGK
jgi:hypothetical protein